MSNWDLMMPGMGLTAIGITGVTISYAEIAHTFIDGMHALTGLTMFIGLIFLSAGILEGGVSTSNRAKATTLVILSIALSFGMYAFTLNTVSTVATFAGILIGIAFPAIMFAYVVTKIPEYARPVGIIFCLAAGVGIAAFIAFGFVSPDTYLIDEPVIEEADEAPVVPEGAEVFELSVLEGSSVPDTPDYDPDHLDAPLGSVLVWTNDDISVHTVTSVGDFGEAFDSELFGAGETYTLNTAGFDAGLYEYTCIVHPWMNATFSLS